MIKSIDSGHNTMRIIFSFSTNYEIEEVLKKPVQVINDELKSK